MRKRKIKYLPFVFFCVSFLVEMGCRKTPTDWDTSWTAPIGSGRITIEQILGSSRLATDEWGWYHLVLDTTIEDFGWEDVVKVKDTTLSKSYSMPFTLSVPPGVNIINQFQNENFLNTGSAALRKLYLRSGKLRYKLYNHINGQIQCTYELPSAYINGIPLQLNATAFPGTSASPFLVEGEIDLAGCQMDLSGTTGFGFNELRSHIVIRTDPNSTTNAQVLAGDQVKVDMELVDPVVSYAKGYFGTEERAFNRDIGLLTGLKAGSAQLDKGFVQLNVSNYIGMDAFFQLDTCRYFGINGVQTDLIHPVIGVNQSLVRATETTFGISPTNWQLSISDDNSNVIECMETLPTKMNIKAKATFNPFGNVNAYNDFIQTDRIASVRLITDIPLRMAFQDVVYESKIGLDFANESIQQGKIKVRLTNAFPLNIEAAVYAGELLSSSKLGLAVLPSAELEPGTFAPIPQKSSFEIQCTPEQLDLIKLKKYLTIQWKMNTPDYPNLVGFRPEYYLEAVAVGQADLNLSIGDE